ncbi:cell cycle checkpoint control protein RAD9A-like [Procambarus clarkii]|uniref:cell cycle checkpoint control protein RAD9A n=1 Tax=Procambarus clarkii TaxID=6728 RepID=UPI001E671F76|nr:cell cycle checkpoint control protein RAD9A-like [Procambarus clarkii]
MKCIVPGVNIKVFGRVMHSMAKIGDELYVEPDSTGVIFRTVNSSRSAFASFHFGSGFFTHFDEGLGGQQSNAGDEIVKCKVAMKAFINVLKSIAVLEKTVERCKLTLDGDDAKLGLQLTCRHGIVKSCSLPFIECETLQAVYDKTSCTNHIQSQSRVLSDAVLNFQLNQEEVTLCVSPEKTVLRNYVDDEPDPGKAIHTMLTLESGEFDDYNISSECEVTFCLKELRAILAFAEPVNLPISSHFSEPGSPMIFSIDNSPMFEGTFVLATLSQKPDTQISGSHTSGKRITQPVRKKQAPESPSCSQTPAMNRITQSINDSIQVEQVNNISNGKRGNLSSPCKSTGLRKPSTPLRNVAAPHLSSMQPRDTSNMNGNTSQLEISLPNLDVKNTVAEEEEEDIVPGTPPSKKLKFLFRRCFESTFDPQTIPGHNNILAGDSDDDS